MKYDLKYALSDLAVKLTYLCSYERAVWVQSLPSLTYEVCSLSIGEIKLFLFFKYRYAEIGMCVKYKNI